MAFQLMKNCKIYLDGYDISGCANKVGMKYGAESLDKTTFGATFKQKMSGQLNAEVNIEGYWEADGTSPSNYKIDDIVINNMGIKGKLLTICPTDGSPGEVAFSLPSIIHEYDTGAPIGELLPFKCSGNNTDVLARGTILENSQKTASGNGTARNLGAVTLNQKLYAAVHVIAVGGSAPTLNLKIQSDDAQTFTTPTDRITYSPMTGIGSQWATPIVGPISDTWWRVSYTISGTGPSFGIVVVLSIQ